MRILRKTAGWWQVDSTEPHQELHIGDGPADVMDMALKEIDRLYLDQWGRLPKPEEIKALFDFCFSPIRNRTISEEDRMETGK